MPSAATIPESIPTAYPNPALTSMLHSDPYNDLTAHHNVAYSIPHQATDFHTMTHQSGMLLNPPLAQAPLMSLQPVQPVQPYPSEDNGRKRSREQETLDPGDNSDSDHLEEAYIDDEENVNLQRLQLQQGEMPSLSGHPMAPFSAHDESALVPQLMMPHYPTKIHKIGTSRPRKRQSPSPASGNSQPSIDSGGGSGTSKKRSGMSLVERIWHGIYEGTKLAKQFRGDIGADVCHT